MLQFDFNKAIYGVSGVQGFRLSDALRVWKAKFETVQHFKREIVTHPALERLGEFVADNVSLMAHQA